MIPFVTATLLTVLVNLFADRQTRKYTDQRLLNLERDQRKRGTVILVDNRGLSYTPKSSEPQGIIKSVDDAYLNVETNRKNGGRLFEGRGRTKQSMLSSFDLIK